MFLVIGLPSIIAIAYHKAFLVLVRRRPFVELRGGQIWKYRIVGPIVVWGSVIGLLGAAAAGEPWSQLAAVTGQGLVLLTIVVVIWGRFGGRG